MKTLLNYRSFIKVALIIVVVVLMASQMTDAYARGWSNYGLKERAKEWTEKYSKKYSKKHIKKYHACNQPDCRKCKRNHHKDEHKKARRKLCSEILPILEAQNVVMDEIYNKLDPNGTGYGLEYPDAPVEKTGKLCSKVLPVLEEQNVVLDKINKSIETGGSLECPDAPVAKTGQTESFGYFDDEGLFVDVDDDGKLQKGVAWPNSRFTINTDGNGNPDGTVTDNLTGLIWDQNADRFFYLHGTITWSEALKLCNNLAASDHDDLNDGSVAGDWRLPNVRELQSLVHYGFSGPALPDTTGTAQYDVNVIDGDPFINAQAAMYWSSNTTNWRDDLAWYVEFEDGVVVNIDKNRTFLHVWCVRGGQ